MDVISVTDKFKIILDLINKLPEFNGNTNCLVDFIDRVDSLAHILSTFDQNTIVLLSGYIKDKIVGKAKIELQKHGRQNTWDEVKTVLKHAFSEKLSTELLIDQIRTLRVKTNIKDYYETITQLLSRINNVYLLDNNQLDKDIIDSNNRIALNAFKNNLPEPTKSIILSRNPKSLNEAYIIIVEINHQYFGPNGFFQNSGQSSRSYNFNGRQESSQTNANNSNRNNNFYHRNSNNLNSSTYNNNNRQNQNYNYQNNRYLQNQNNNSQSFRNNNTTNYQHNNHNRQSFQSRRSNRFSNPEPMDISVNESRNLNQSAQNFQRGRQNDYPI